MWSGNWNESRYERRRRANVKDHVHDCVVVGAGPAGSAAALQMARDGLDVVLLERGTRPGEKNVMSGVLLTNKLQSLVPDFREQAPLQRCITAGYERYLLGEEEILTLPALRSYRPDRYPSPPYTVFRSEFDAWFAQQAVEAGAELFTETLVEDLLWDDGRVAGVRTRRGDLRARVVIGADGVNSTVADRARLGVPPTPSALSLIVRQVLDLPAKRIEERFHLRPGEGVLSLFYGPIAGPNGHKGIYYSELYTNRDSLSMTAEVPLDVLQACGVPAYDVLTERERHPYIARLIEGAALREYQAHLIPWGGMDNLDDLYRDGVLLVGDAGRFTTKNGVGSWPSMASGTAAARTVKHACDRRDFSESTLSVYQNFLAAEGLVDTQREARREWEGRDTYRKMVIESLAPIFQVAGRYADEWVVGKGEHPYSVWGEAYHSLVKPVAPWYLRWPLGLAAWMNTRRWRRQQREIRRR
jgi:electron transfer flavoprotein-quinone oxidoreductase